MAFDFFGGVWDFNGAGCRDLKDLGDLGLLILSFAFFTADVCCCVFAALLVRVVVGPTSRLFVVVVE